MIQPKRQGPEWKRRSEASRASSSSANPPDFLIWDVICTDRGQHPPRRIAALFDPRAATRPGDLFAVEPGASINRHSTRSARAADPSLRDAFSPSISASDTLTGTLTFRCKTCRRSVRLSQARAGAVLDALLTDDPARRVVDICWPL